MFQILEERPYSHPVDWWSLGVLAHRLCTGGLPWPRGADHRVQRELVDLGKVDLTVAVSADPSLRSFVLACFHPDDFARNKAAIAALEEMGRKRKEEEEQDDQVDFLKLFSAD